jgi:glycosyltransferase involved in cell wall biosynthesis
MAANAASAKLEKMHVLLVASLRDYTGNSVTARRLAQGIGAAKCTCVDVTSFADADALQRRVHDDAIDMVLGIHAFRSGRLMIGLSVPYVIVLGGTDMNVNVSQPEKRAAMEQALQGAGAVIAFTAEMLATLVSTCPSVRDKAHLVPQAIVTFAPPLPVLADALPTDAAMDTAKDEQAVLDQLDVCAGELLLLLPAGLRPVKDVLFAVDAIAEWHGEGSGSVLRVVGPQLDIDYTRAVEQALGKLQPGRAAAWCGVLPQRELHLAMRAAHAVLNTSQSEGMCNSILEAFAIGTPVLARRNQGNAALVVEGETGLLFDTPQELVARARLLLSDRGLCTKLRANAQQLIAREHSAEREAQQYSAILQGVLDNMAGSRHRQRHHVMLAPAERVSAQLVLDCGRI